ARQVQAELQSEDFVSAALEPEQVNLLNGKRGDGQGHQDDDDRKRLEAVFAYQCATSERRVPRTPNPLMCYAGNAPRDVGCRYAVPRPALLRGWWPRHCPRLLRLLP